MFKADGETKPHIEAIGAFFFSGFAVLAFFACVYTLVKFIKWAWMN